MTVRPASAAMPGPGAAANRPEPAVLAALVGMSTDGLALLTDDGRYLWAPAWTSSGGVGRPRSGSGSSSSAPSR